MKMSAEQFAELAASFASHPSSGKHDHRRAARRALQAKLEIALVRSGHLQPPLPVMVCDFSARGIGFMSPQQIDVGEQFVIELPRQQGGKVRLLCQVANSRHLQRGLYRIGAEFIGTAPEMSAIRNGSSADDDAREVERIRQSMLG